MNLAVLAGFAGGIVAVILIVQASGILTEQDSVANVVFEDVTEDNPHQESIEEASRLGLVRPSSDTIFGPADPVTREELAVSVVKLMEWPVADDEDEVFSDVEGDPEQLDGADYIAVLAQRAVMSGTTDDPPAFLPDEAVTVATFAVVLSRALKERLELPALRNVEIDAQPVSDETRDALQLMHTAGYFEGSGVDLTTDDIADIVIREVEAVVLVNAHRDLSGS